MSSGERAYAAIIDVDESYQIVRGKNHSGVRLDSNGEDYRISLDVFRLGRPGKCQGRLDTKQQMR
jgi:hypothetical protein